MGAIPWAHAFEEVTVSWKSSDRQSVVHLFETSLYKTETEPNFTLLYLYVPWNNIATAIPSNDMSIQVWAMWPRESLISCNSSSIVASCLKLSVIPMNWLWSVSRHCTIMTLSRNLAVLHCLALLRLCSHMLTPSHFLHWLRTRLCSHILLHSHSIHMLHCHLCSQSCRISGRCRSEARIRRRA